MFFFGEAQTDLRWNLGGVCKVCAFIAALRKRRVSNAKRARLFCPRAFPGMGRVRGGFGCCDDGSEVTGYGEAGRHTHLHTTQWQQLPRLPLLSGGGELGCHLLRQGLVFYLPCPMRCSPCQYVRQCGTGECPLHDMALVEGVSRGAD